MPTRIRCLSLVVGLVTTFLPASLAWAQSNAAKASPSSTDNVSSAKSKSHEDGDREMALREYEQIAGTLMVAEARFYVTRLGLSEYPRSLDPYRTKTNVNPPSLGSLGSIETRMYLYSFLGSDSKPITNAHNVEMCLEPGKLAYIILKDPFVLVKTAVGNDPMAMNKWLSQLKNQLTTNSAYQLATQWLRSVEVDVDALERKYQAQISQHFYYNAPMTWKLGETPPPDTTKTLLPIFDVSWGGDPESNPPVWVEINGATKEMIHLRMEDTRFSKRRPILIGGKQGATNVKARPRKQLQPFPNFDSARTNQPARN